MPIFLIQDAEFNNNVVKYIDNKVAKLFL